ncbi:MAG TPA: DUF4159 domain-containing protein, partial [Gemmataceae bacterium]|nr:DUF4159 domain-containing protein [Gemmataceae bacterium]
WRLIISSLACLGLFGFPSGLRAAQPPAQDSLVERVNKAIDAGVRFLYDEEKGTGNWESIDLASQTRPGGWTALATLALLNAGVKPSEAIIDRSLAFLRTVEPQHTYVVGLQIMVFAEAGRSEDRERIQQLVDWLIKARTMSGQECRGWSYQTGTPMEPDNSNTQYALLGLHAGQQAGARIDRAVWESIRDLYIRTQTPEGGWYYSRKGSREPSLTMTTAGLCGLLIAGMELNPGREQIQADGHATDCGLYKENKPLERALGWISNSFSIRRRSDATFYNLYGIERAGRLTGLRFLGEYDWYRMGCEYLTEPGVQQENGSWFGPGPHDTWPTISTSFALLFLSKGRTPVLVSKLVHGPGNDWNNDRNDARNLVNYASTELFRGRPMAWQVFDTNRVEIGDNEQLLKLAGELGKSSVVYFNGHQAPQFKPMEVQLLKQYVEQGGFVFAEACCGRKEFDAGFRELMREIFPDHTLRPLPAEHPIWRAHAFVPPGSISLEGIDYGCKTVVVYSPQDLSCYWEGNLSKEGRGQLAFRLGGNIIAYATGMEPPKARLAPVDIVVPDPQGKEFQRGYLKVAQLRHEGDWQPAPNAMRNLMADLRKSARMNVSLQTEAISATDPNLVDFKFLYMHGRADFRISPEGAKNLRTTLETGGTILADACCGKKAFDTAFRRLVEQVYPEGKLEAIPPNDPLFGKDVNGTAITTVRCRTELASGNGQSGEFRAMAPALEGLRIGNRWAIIYSKYDLGCALEKHQSTDCLGHDHASALLLGKAAVFYALGH